MPHLFSASLYSSLCLQSIFLFLYFSLLVVLCVRVCACLTCWLVCVCVCVNMKGPNRKILLDMLCSVGVQRCLPPSPSSPPPVSKPAGIGNVTIPPSALLPRAVSVFVKMSLLGIMPPRQLLFLSFHCST